MSRNTIVLGLIAAILLLGGVAYFQAQGNLFGGQLFETDKVQFFNGLYAGKSKQFQLKNDGSLYASSTVQFDAARFYATSTLDSNLVVTQSNTATSSIQVGCVQTYATSTDTPIKQMFFASSTLNIDGASVTAGFGGGTIQGLVLWGFGKCPRI